MNDIIKKIFTVNLGVKKTEKVLVFTDIITADEQPISREELQRRRSLRRIAREVARTGREFSETTYVEFPSLKGHGMEPPPLVWEAAFGKRAVDELRKAGVLDKILAKDAGAGDGEAIVRDLAVSPDAIVALSNFSTSHTRFRDLLTRCMGARYASMPLFDESMLAGVMRADWQEVERRTLGLVEKMTNGDEVFITSPNGTAISFSIKGRPIEADTGILTEPGAFSNLPAGEAFLAPVEGTAVGTLILEWAPTRRLESPVTLDIKDGLVYNVDGRDDLTWWLKDKLDENPLFGNIAELGIGTNAKATRPDNILETEKILGTVHIALGDNSSFGGKVSVEFHQDFIFFEPTMEVLKGEDKIEILVEGDPRF
jgi:leucyl aminopeptidase (aminopeptidase T)